LFSTRNASLGSSRVLPLGSLTESLSPKMASTASPSWLKETPLHFEEISRHHSTPLTIYLPAINDIGERQVLSPEGYDFLPPQTTEKGPSFDAQYHWQNLSQESGIFNQRETYPRSLLWRIVSGGTLTIHSVDSFRPKTFPRNRPLAGIHLRFPVKIRPNCVGFSDVSETTILYVLTEDCVLYSIPLMEHTFSGENRRPEAIADSIGVHRPLFMQARFGQGRVSLELPHFMYVLPNSEKIIFAMQDGSIHQYNPFGIITSRN
jgi:hypothetical protein